MSQRKRAVVLSGAFALALAAGTPAHADDYGVSTPIAGSVFATTVPLDETRSGTLEMNPSTSISRLVDGGSITIPNGHFVSGSCVFTGQLLDASHILVEFTGTAVASGHTAAASTGVHCEVFNAGGYGSSQAALPGNVAVAPPQQVVLGLSTITVCVTAQATFIDNHNAAQVRTCR